MSGPRVTLTPRDVRARLHATCSDVGLDVGVVYETGPAPSGTEVQQRIQSLVQLPSIAWLVSIGGLELYFGGGGRLSGLALYANFVSATPENLLPLLDAPPAWLALPDFDPAEDDRFATDAVVRISVDRQGGVIRLRLTDTGQEHRPYSLADGLVAWIDAADRLTGLVVHGIEWTLSVPV